MRSNSITESQQLLSRILGILHQKVISAHRDMRKGERERQRYREREKSERWEETYYSMNNGRETETEIGKMGRDLLLYE